MGDIVTAEQMKIILETQELPKMIREMECEGEKMEFSMTPQEWLSHSSDKIQKILNEILTRYPDAEFSSDCEEEIEVTLEELILNSAIECEEKIGGNVKLTAHIGKKGLVVHLRDNGSGFCHKEALAKNEDESTLTRDSFFETREDKDFPGGAGMFCLRTFTKSFKYNGKGNAIVVAFEYRGDEE